MRSVSTAIRAPPHEVGKLKLSTELFLDNRAEAALPGGTRSSSNCSVVVLSVEPLVDWL
jgi:hypothetical protein